MYFWNFHISANQELWRSGNSGNKEIQKIEIMYLCRQAGMHVCMHACVYVCVYMYGDGNGVDPPSTTTIPFMTNNPYTTIHVCIFVNTIQEEMDME